MACVLTPLSKVWVINFVKLGMKHRSAIQVINPAITPWNMWGLANVHAKSEQIYFYYCSPPPEGDQVAITRYHPFLTAACGINILTMCER